MAIQLGDINFRLGADARALGKSVQQLKNFGRTVDQVSGQTSAAGKIMESAFRRQEKAATDALRSVINMNSKMRGFDYGVPLIRQTNKAWRDYNRTLTQGQLSAVEFQRAQAQFRNSIAATSREFTKLKTVNTGVQAPVKNLNTVFRDLASTAVLVNGPLGGIAARLTVLSALSRSSGIAIAALVAGIAGGITVAYSFGRAILDVGQQFAAYRQILLAVTGQQVLANISFTNAVKVAQDTGQSVKAIIPAYAKFMAASKGTNLEGRASTEIFKSVSLVMSRIQAPAEQTQGVFKALEQIMSKGSVQAEELRGQLGDRLPGAFQIAARAMGLSTAELGKFMKEGKIAADDFLPKFAAELRKTFGLEGVDSIDNYRTSVNRLGNEYTLLLDRLNSVLGITNRVKGGIDSLAAGLKYLAQNLSTIIALFGAAGGAVLVMIAPKILAGFITLAKLIRTATVAVVGLNVAMLANPATALVSIIARLALVTGGAVAGFYAFRDAVDKTSDTTIVSLDSIDQYIKGQELLQQSTKASTDTIIDQVNKQIEALKIQKKAIEDQIPEATISAPKSTIGDDIRNGLLRVFRDIPAIVSLLTPDPNGEIRKQLKNVTGELTDYQKRLAELTNLQASAVKAGSNAAVEQSTEYKKASESVKDLVANVDALHRISNAQAGGLNNVLNAERFEEARKIISGLTSNELVALNAELDKLGVAGVTLSAKLVDLITSQDMLTESTAKYKAELEKQPEALRAYNEALTETLDRTAAMANGSIALKEFEDNLKISNTVDTYRKKLQDAGLTTADITMKTKDLQKALEGLDVATEQAEKFEKIKGQFQDIATNGVDKFADSLVHAARTGENVFDGLGNVIEDILADILRSMIEFTVAAPIKDFFAEQFGGMGSNGSSNASSGSSWINAGMQIFSAWLASANGNVFNNGTVTKMASGGLLNRPTMMSSASGPVLGGEAGTEAIMPLARNSSGALGVKANLSGATTGALETVTVNIYGADGEATTKQSRTGGNMTIDVMFRQIENRMSDQISKGGTKLNRSLESRYALNSARGNQQ